MHRRSLGLAALLALSSTGCEPAPAPSPDADLRDAFDGGLPVNLDADLRDAVVTLDADLRDAVDGGASATLERYCDEQVEALCRGTAACGCPGANPEDCLIAQTRACESALAPLIGSALLGEVDFDPALGRACIEDTRAFAERCDAPTSTNRPASCLGAFTDRARVGGACARFSAGLPCADGAGACVPGAAGLSCVPLATEGMGCTAARCVDGLVCDGASCVRPGAAGSACVIDGMCAGGLVCASTGRCAPPATRGEACASTASCGRGLACVEGRCADGPAPGSSCDSTVSSSCASADVCLPGDGPSTCARRAAEGESCPRFDDCAAGLACDFAATPPVCRALPPAGMPCVSGQCADGAGCVASGASGSCETLPGAGMPCLVGASLPCAAGLGCDPDTGLCEPGGAEGMPCVAGACASGFVCDFGTPARCRAPVGEGERCTSDEGCRSGLHCDFETNRCASALADGALCASDAACRPGSACVFDGTSNTCRALPSGSGEPCMDRCGGGLRCVLPPGTCARGACLLVD
jgi:hypothetical protein